MDKLNENGSKVKDGLTVVNARTSAYTPAKFEPTWIETKNERNLEVAMEMCSKVSGDGPLMELVGPAGRGKTRLVRRYASHKDCVYLLCIETWKRSELPMLRALCKELGVANERLPYRASEAFLTAADLLLKRPRAVFFDEMDLIPKRINLVRQLAEFTGGIFVLIGEETLSGYMAENQRVWSRTFQSIHFEPVDVNEIGVYGRTAAGLEILPPASDLMSNSPGGKDWRVIKRIVINLVEIANVHRSRIITEEMARQAINMGLKGRQAGVRA